MVILNNENIQVEIAELGAEIRRVLVDGEDRFWSGDPDVWSGVSPVLFPICGGIKDDKFIFEGKEYILPKHGFARKTEFTLEDKGQNFATFLLKSNENTLKMYPWEFEFRVKYILSSYSIKVEYSVLNKDTKVMYTAVGSHEAYACPEGIEDYDIIFEKEETLRANEVIGTLISRKTTKILHESKTFPLYYKYFDIDALVFTDVKSKFATLRNRKNGKSLSVAFPDCKMLLIWTKPNAKYICIEPWTTCPSYVDDDYDIAHKEGMTKVNPDGEFNCNHTIYF